MKEKDKEKRKSSAKNKINKLNTKENSKIS